MGKKNKESDFSNFYIVKSIGKTPWQIRNIDDTSKIWGRFNSQEDAEEAIKEAKLTLDIEQRFKVFVDSIILDLNIPEEVVRRKIHEFAD